jgi:hypothetical protein
MTYGPEASHFTGPMPRLAQPSMFVQDSGDDSFDASGSEDPTPDRKSRWQSWWPISHAHWPR